MTLFWHYPCNFCCKCVSSLLKPNPMYPLHGICPSISHGVSCFSMCHANSVRRLQRRTTAKRTQIWFQSFDVHPVCFWVMARLSMARFFLIFDTGFLLGADEDGDMETRIITFEREGVTAFRDSLHLHSSERSSPLSLSNGGSAGHSSSPHPFISCQHPNFVCRFVQNHTR